MQDEYFYRLSGHVRELVEEVEKASGVPIVVTVRPDKRVSCRPHLSQGEIFTPAPEALGDGSVIHEVLHLRRFLVEGVPLLIVRGDYEQWQPGMEDRLTRQDNAFEHLIVVPEELRRCPERRGYWEQMMLQRWNEIRESEADNREAAAALWAFALHVIPRSEAHVLAHEVLAQRGYQQLAERFSAALLPVLHHKEEAIRIWFHELGIDPNMAAFEYLQTHLGARKEVALVGT